jgi:hypothetical protein
MTPMMVRHAEAIQGQEMVDLGLSPNSTGGETYAFTNGFVHSGRQEERERSEIYDSSIIKMNPRGMQERMGKAHGVNLAAAASCFKGSVSFLLIPLEKTFAPTGHDTRHGSVDAFRAFEM